MGEDNQVFIDGKVADAIAIDKLHGLSFQFIEYDGLALSLKGSDGKTYFIESTYEDPLQCWVMNGHDGEQVEAQKGRED